MNIVYNLLEFSETNWLSKGSNNHKREIIWYEYCLRSRI
jgi:hypothetical protein